MVYPRKFLSSDNFQLAFERIVRGLNRDYKQFYRHLFASYNVSLRENLQELIRAIARSSYQPSSPTIVFNPKKSGILRPLTLLSFEDLIVYQALVNVVADSMKPLQDEHAYSKNFGAIYTGPKNSFFFRSWKKGYQEFNRTITAAFNRGNVYVADFDLVSCYELIDHNLLRSCITRRVRSSALVNLLCRCLAAWTTNRTGGHLRHGLPQGPEASAFLAECVLFKFDAFNMRGIRYIRYVDDIKLMAKDEIPLRRALLKLDLMSKELGLVPQAQKISLGKVERLEDITKMIPSTILADVENEARGSQKSLYRMLCGSVKRSREKLEIHDSTKFKYALLRLNPRRDVLRRIKPLLVERPDCSYVFASYLKKFPSNREAAEILRETLKRDPTYDAAAAHYIEAMDVCEPATKVTPYRRVIETASRRSEEKSIILRTAILSFRARRSGPKDALRLIEKEKDPRVRNIVLHRLFGPAPGAPYKLCDCVPLLEKEVAGGDADLARYAALNLLYHSLNEGTLWSPNSKVHRSVQLLLVGLGLRTRGPSRESVLKSFFEEFGVTVAVPWNKALGQNLADAEHRCLRIRQLQVGDPTALVLMLDTFNEVLVQQFSRTHSTLVAAYTGAAGKKSNPDMGNWLRHPLLARVLPCAVPWFLKVHDTRVSGDLAHAKSKKGKPTKPITHENAARLIRGGKVAWWELLTEWKKLL